MAVKEPANYDEALERISELEEELESLDALLLLRERAASDTGGRHSLEDVAQRLRQVDPDPRRLFCIEAGLDYDDDQSIWAAP